MSGSRPVLQPSSLGKFIDLESCPEYFKLNIEEVTPDRLQHGKDSFTEAFQGSNIIERKSGQKFEENIVRVIRNHVSTFIDVNSLTFQEAYDSIPNYIEKHVDGCTIRNDKIYLHGVDGAEITLNDPESTYEEHLQNRTTVTKQEMRNTLYDVKIAYTEALFKSILTQQTHDTSQYSVSLPAQNTKTKTHRNNTAKSDPIVIFQPGFNQEIGCWEFSGDADIVCIWLENNQVRIRVIDVKLANEEQTDHQIQTVTYSKAIEAITKPHDNVPAKIETGVITRDADFIPLTPENTPEFNRESREADLQQLTQENGLLDKIYTTPESETTFQLNSKCSTCKYNEACYTMSVESAGLELLGLDTGVQDTLQKHGVSDLHDLAKLAYTTDNYPHPVKTKKPDEKRKHRETYNKLAGLPTVGQKLPTLIQQAQHILGVVSPQKSYTSDTKYVKHITNTGYGNLPSDETIWSDSNSDLTADDLKEGSLVRVYMNVQYDHIRDSINGLAFTVCSSASKHEDISFSTIDTDMPEDKVSIFHAERELITEFVEALYDAVEKVGDGIDFTGYKQSNPFLHFYTFAEDEIQLLQEKLTKHMQDTVTFTDSLTKERHGKQDGVTIHPGENDVLESFDEMINYQEKSEEKIISAVVSDVNERVVTRAATKGLINIYDEFYPNDDSERFTQDDWKYEPVDKARLNDNESEIDLQEVFGYRYFNNAVSYNYENNNIRLHHENESQGFDGWYNLRVRTAAQIPLAYMWGGTGNLEGKWNITSDDVTSGVAVYPYIYHSNANRETKIVEEDLKALLERLCHCVRHIEQGIEYKNTMQAVENEQHNENDDTVQEQLG